MTLSEFFFDIPLYTEIPVNTEYIENYETFKEIINCDYAPTFDGYNPIRKIESSFEVITDLEIPEEDFGEVFSKEGGVRKVEIRCKRYEDVFAFLIQYDVENKLLNKIGQFPSVADFHLAEVKQYNKLLSKEKLNEFTKAIGLAANGVGIGSFVYLRRIFEHLILEAYTNALSDGAINEANYQRARMDEKINLLHSYLPTFLVENKTLYSILSVGIHELDEQTCLKYFDTLRVSIEIILDEKLDELRKKEKMESAKKKLSGIHGEIKS